MIHELKIWPEPFELLRLGVKTCEVRYEQGREYRAGDVLKLREWFRQPARDWSGQMGAPGSPGYTGRWITALVTEALRLDRAPREWGIQIEGCGVVVMSLRVLERPPAVPAAPSLETIRGA